MTRSPTSRGKPKKTFSKSLISGVTIQPYSLFPLDLTLCRGAIDVLQAYFDSIGGRPESTKSASTKKRGRQSTGKTDTPDKQVKKAKTEEVPKKKDGRGRKKKSSPGIMDLDSTLKDGWEPPKPLPGAWEEGVLSVQTIEGNDDGTKWAYLSWADAGIDGKKRQTKALLSTCYVACPQVVSAARTTGTGRDANPGDRCSSSSSLICKFSESDSIPVDSD